ncbi:MAG: hypothetical protein WBF18_11460 [Solirubrobacterales bacterium]
MRRRLHLLFSVTIFFALAASAEAESGVIYDQTDGGAPFTHWTSQDFAAADDQFDSEIAADFTVPEGQSWKVTKIETVGSNQGEPGSPPPSARVTFFSDSGGRPGGVLATQTSAASPLDYALSLPTALKLTPGAYWVSVQAVGGNTQEQWYWRFNGNLVGRPAMFRNIPNGSGFNCMTFTPIADCIPGAPKKADALFRLFGSATLLPDGKPTLGKPKLNKKKGTAKLPVSVTSAGTVTLTGKNLKRQEEEPRGAETNRLPVNPTGKLKKKLKQKGTAKAKAKVRFTAASGASGVAKTTIKLRRRTSRGRVLHVGPALTPAPLGAFAPGG